MHITKVNLTKTLARILSLAITPFLAFVTTQSASAWGPERQTFTMESPASYAVFNSIENNPTIGDERDFVRVGQINADVTQLSDNVDVLPGHQYLVYIYYHNDASSTYNGPEYGNRGVAFQSRIATTFPTLLAPSEKGEVSATISAQNTVPDAVWDEAYFTNNTGNKIYLNYVDGSAKIYNDWGVNGSTMPDALFTAEGTPIGLNALNGIILGCEEYHGVVSYVVEARAVSASLDKTASLDGVNYQKDITVTPGAEITFKLDLKNTGDVALLNTTIKDSLPDGLEIVPGSVQFTANDSGVWDSLSDNIIDTGYNLGRFGLGNSATLIYRAKARTDISCPGIKVTNTATLIYDSESTSGDSLTSSSNITVEKTDCAVPPIDESTSDPAPEETPTEIVNTGPLEITMAAVIVLAIVGAGFYFWRTKYALRKVEDEVKGKDTAKSSPAETDTRDADAASNPKK